MTVLAVEGAAKSFGEIAALGGVSFEVAGGEVLGLLGPNGSGKSTLIRSIVTLEHLDAGRILVNGADAAADPAGARAALGYAGQEMALDKVLTGREFLRFQAGLVHLPKREIAGRVDEMLGKLDLLDAAGRRCGEYSGGMKRRIDLAASLLHRPRLLVLDEPSTGLDYDARRRLWDFLLQLRGEGTAILVATHDFEEADVLCDRVVLLGHGRVAADGTPAGLRDALGAWILSASLHEHPEEGDAARLAELFSGFPGRVLPADPRAAERSQALPAESGRADGELGREWSQELEKRAAAAGTPLFSLSVRRPTLQDVYRVEVGAGLGDET